MAGFGPRVLDYCRFRGEYGVDHGRAVDEPGAVLFTRDSFPCLLAEIQLQQQQPFQQRVGIVDLGEERFDPGSVAGPPRLLELVAEANDPFE